MSSNESPQPNISLRPVSAEDSPILHAFESDPVWRSVAMMKPRSKEAFHRIWDRITSGEATDIIQRTILYDGEVCGTVGARIVDDQWHVGYGLGAQYWGRGIATRALTLYLNEVSIRPLIATTAASNAGSIRVLEKNGFTLQSSRYAPETDRWVGCDELRFVIQ